MRKLVAGIAVLAALVALSPAAAAAPARSGRAHHPAALAATELVVTGSFTGTGMLLSGCGLFHQVVTGSGDWTELGLSTFTLDFCLGSGSSQYPVFDGTFTITAADGGTLTGEVSGSVEAGGAGPEFPLHLVLTVTGGTGRYEGATGSIAMEGAFGFGAATVHGTVEGTVTLRSTPSSRDDCLDGGWQHVVDDNGQPFPSLGHCIYWVVRHT